MNYVTRITLSVSLGGFLMGFDASVISGAVGFLTSEFALSSLQLGWVVSSLALMSMFAMMAAGPASDRYGRRAVLFAASILYFFSAILSAIAPSYEWLVVARMIGGVGVGAALIIAPMYISEIAPAEIRGRLVSFNQLNIVIGISVAFFTNYLILQFSNLDSYWVAALYLDQGAWRWMLGVEALPALLYFMLLFGVPESPRWLLLRGQEANALAIMAKIVGLDAAKQELQDVQASLSSQDVGRVPLSALLNPKLRLVLLVGLAVAVLQQITGINAVFFYAPMIFEQSGIGTDASFLQAVLVGLANLIFTVVAMLYIDRVGRRKLLLFGVTGVAVSMFLIAYGFAAATYTLSAQAIANLDIDPAALSALFGIEYSNDVAFKNAIVEAAGQTFLRDHAAALITAAIQINPVLILVGILAFVSSFAVSLGPVMWVLFSELFPNRERGIAISAVGFANAAVSFGVQFSFPWELSVLGSSLTFFLYGVFALIGLVIVARFLPETKGKSLEQLEVLLAR